MHAALKGFEKQRQVQEEIALHGKRVAKRDPVAEHPKSGRSSKSLKGSVLGGGRYRTRTYDLVRVKHAL